MLKHLQAEKESLYKALEGEGENGANVEITWPSFLVWYLRYRLNMAAFRSPLKKVFWRNVNGSNRAWEARCVWGKW